MMAALTPKAVFLRMQEATAGQDTIYNFHCIVRMADFLLETELFPREVLEAYSRKNLGKALHPTDIACFSSQRGGPQGDYSLGMGDKIVNVVDCLNRFPQSKRAVITIANNAYASHTVDSDAKCIREIHFHLHPGPRLDASVFFRAHAVEIFPKNIHFLGTLMTELSERLDCRPHLGDLFLVATQLSSTRMS